MVYLSYSVKVLTVPDYMFYANSSFLECDIILLCFKKSCHFHFQGQAVQEKPLFLDCLTLNMKAVESFDVLRTTCLPV